MLRFFILYFNRFVIAIGFLLSYFLVDDLQANQLSQNQQVQDSTLSIRPCGDSDATFCRTEISSTTGILQRSSPPPLRTPTLVILVDFDDWNGRSTQTAWNKRLFDITNSVHHYYREVSYFQEGVRGHDMYPVGENSGVPNNGVVGWYRINWGLEGKVYNKHPATIAKEENMGDWERNKDRRFNEQIAVVGVQAADNDVDFSSFDDDTNGFISSDELHVVIILAGYEKTTNSSIRDFSTARHHTALDKFDVTLDGVRLFEQQIAGSDVGGGFCLLGEIDYQRKDVSEFQIGIGLIAHELGHDLGLPDLYETDEKRESAGIGVWGLMANGDFLGDPFGSSPAHLCAWSKTFLRWVEPTVVKENLFNQQILQVEDNPQIYLLPVIGHNYTSVEYFLVENRQKVLYDKLLPHSGLLIWHIDPTKLNRGNNDVETHKLVDLECADQTGIGHNVDADPLDRNPNGDPRLNGAPTNLWYLGNKTDFLVYGASIPDSRDYQDRGTFVEVREISASGSMMTADLIVAPLQSTPATQLSASAFPSAIAANGQSSATISVQLLNQYNQVVTTATNPVTFAITSGSNSATLVGANPATPVEGVATIKLQSTLTSGLVTIEASSPGLTPSTTSVYVYGNPTRVSGTITSNTTWTLANSPYEVIDDVTVAQGITLTIEPGVTVRFNRERDIYVNGALVANGTASNKIVFTANSDSPFPGYWGGVKFNNSNISNISVLNYCQFLYGGQAFYSEAAPVALDARANPTITNITLINNLRNGIHLAEGTYNSNILLNVVGIPHFLINDDIRVGQGYTMTINPGVVLKFGSERDLYIDGALIAKGTPSQPIIFTAFADDAYGGDTNGDGQTFPSPGSWGGIRFNNSNLGSSSVLNYCQFYYAGQNFYSEASPVSVDGRINPKITNTTVANNKLNGIRLLEFTYTSPVLLDIIGIPYFIVFDDVNIAQGVKMAIKPGVILKLGSERDLYINGALDARGTSSQPIIFTSMRDDPHGGDTNGDGSTVPRAGDWGGVRFNDSNIDSLSTLSYCEFYYGGQGFYSEPSPVAIDAQINPVVSNLMLENNTRNGIRLLELSYNTNMLLDVVGVPYTILFDDVFVGSNARMTIKPGVIIKLGNERDLIVRGALIADGTADQSIVFTSMNDDARGGDTNNDGPTLPSPGGWGGVRLEESTIDHLSVLKYCQFYYGGQGFYSEPSPLTVDPRTRPAMANLAFANNSNNGIDLLGGSFNTHLFLETIGVPYTVRRDDISISQGTRMTIMPGVTVKLGSERDLHVQGAFIANGTLDKPIIFTSLKDDANGGDTNGDGQSLGIPGDWGGIRFFDTSDDLNSSLDFCRIAFGGQGFYSEQHPLVFDNVSPKVQNTIISNSRSHGVMCYNTASPDFGGGIRSSTGQNSFLGFTDVTDKFVFYNDGNADIYAKFNYWETPDSSTIDKIIFDRNDNGSKGRVIYKPYQAVPTFVSDPAYKIDVPTEFHLGQNYPNPFNPETTIEFTLPKSSRTTIRIYNLVGAEVRTLLDESKMPGYHKITWDGKDSAGRPVPSGVYLYKMQAGDFVAVRKSVVIH